MSRYRVKSMLNRMREDKQMKDYLDGYSGNPDPDLDGDAYELLRYWAGGKYVRYNTPSRD